MKRCRKCSRTSVETAFHASQRTICVRCHGAATKAWRGANPDYMRARSAQRRSKPGWKREKHLRERYGMDGAEHSARYVHQRGLCGVCDLRLDLSSRKTVVDHDHDTGVVRGLLCARCNLLMAAVDRPGWLEKAREYVSA